MERTRKYIAMLLLAASSAFGFGDYQIFSGTNSVDSSGAVIYPPNSGEILQWITAYPDAVDGEPNFNDKATAGLSKAVAVGMPAITLNGVDQAGAIQRGGVTSDTLNLGNLPYTMSATVPAHQGVAVSSDNIYTFDTGSINKHTRDTSVTLLDSNSDVFTGMNPLVNHMSDGFYHGGKLYSVPTYWNGSIAENETLAVYDAGTLELVEFFDISAQDCGGSSCCTDGEFIYVCSFTDGSSIWKYTFSGVFVEEVSLSVPISGAQGSTIKDDVLYISASNWGILAYELNGDYLRHCFFYNNSNTGDIFEGIDFTYEDMNLLLIEQAPSSIAFLDTRQKTVTGFSIKTGVKLEGSLTSEQAIFARYEFSANLRQYYLGLSGGTFFLRLGHGGGTGNIAVSIPNTNSETTITAAYDSANREITISDGAVSNSTPFTEIYRAFNQDTGIGRLVNTPVAGWLDGALYGIEARIHFADGTSDYAFNTPICENSGLTSYDVSGNGNDITWTVGSGDIATMRSGTQDLVNYCGDKGFYVAVQGTAPFIPALNDGSGLAANGLPLTNLGGYPHNNGPFNLLQTDATLLPNAYWSTDGIVFDEKTYADFTGHASGADNVWIKGRDINSVCHITDSITYPVAYEWTPGTYTIMDLYVGIGGCATITSAIPYPVTSGGIGPGGLWYTYDGSHIYIVIP